MQHFGRALLRLAGVGISGGVTSLQSKIVLPTRVPDGLLQGNSTHPDATDPDLFLLEIATYAELRLLPQMLHDIALTWGAFGRLPETFAYILRRHSTAALENSHAVTSRLRHASLAAGWTPIRVFELEAADVLALDEAGLAPFALAAHWDADGEQLAQQVRALVDRQVGDPGEQANLLAAGGLSGVR